MCCAPAQTHNCLMACCKECNIRLDSCHSLYREALRNLLLPVPIRKDWDMTDATCLSMLQYVRGPACQTHECAALAYTRTICAARRAAAAAALLSRASWICRLLRLLTMKADATRTIPRAAPTPMSTIHCVARGDEVVVAAVVVVVAGGGGEVMEDEAAVVTLPPVSAVTCAELTVGVAEITTRPVAVVIEICRRQTGPPGVSKSCWCRL